MQVYIKRVAKTKAIKRIIVMTTQLLIHLFFVHLNSNCHSLINISCFSMNLRGLCSSHGTLGCLLQIFGLLAVGTFAAVSKENVPHSRQKRILWVTSDGRLALPPGTTLVITPSLSMPFVRYPPEGFFSNITVSLPFTSKWGLIGT